MTTNNESSKKIHTSHKFNVGKWLPADFAIMSLHIRGIIAYVKANPTHLTANIIALNDYVTNDERLNKLSNDMFSQVPAKYQYTDYGSELKNWAEFIPLLNGVMTMTQTFNTSGCVGFPINALLDWAMGTHAGREFFLDDGINAHFHAVLNDWSDYLKSPASKDMVLNSNKPVTKYVGHFTDVQYYWLSDIAMVDMANALDNAKHYNLETCEEARQAFIDAFKCPDIQDPHYGFTSWDDFFTREFHDGVRPVASGYDVIVNACESAPYRLCHDVKKQTDIWVKGQPYSLVNIFNETYEQSPLADKYTGGTIYQAFLSAESYHRWHSPVSGLVKTVYNTVHQTPFNSTYYAEASPHDPSQEDNAGPNESQGLIANLAARAIIEITSDNEAIGDMCVIPIGMAECSTCEVTVREGQSVVKGDEIGMFYFGGSTHLLVFQKHVNLTFDLHGHEPGLNAKNIPINAKLATVQ